MSEEKKEIQGWKDVILSPDVPLSALVNFLNILNQRLCGLENVVTVPSPDGGKMISLTDLYELETKAELEKQQAAEKEKEE